jgi:hypothetical protein
MLRLTQPSDCDFNGLWLQHQRTPTLLS